MTDLTAYTDGACSGNPGPGGWGVLMQAFDGETLVRERDRQEETLVAGDLRQHLAVMIRIRLRRQSICDPVSVCHVQW